MKILMGGLAGAGALLLFSACSAKHELSGTCANGAACGGSIVGAWHVVSTCVSIDPAASTNPDCPGETQTASGFKMSGTITYGADLTYSTSLSLSGTLIVTYPTSCLAMTCAQTQADFQSNLSEGGYSSASCADSGGACSCTFVLIPATETETGTYRTTPAGVLTKNFMGSSSGDNSDYCVSGNRLTLAPRAVMAGMDDTTGTVTLTK